jgi:hypothetical protein
MLPVVGTIPVGFIDKRCVILVGTGSGVATGSIFSAGALGSTALLGIWSKFGSGSIGVV